MKLPTEEEVYAAKARALKDFGSAAVELIEVDDPVHVALLMAPHTVESWDRHTDAIYRDALTAHGQVFAERVLYPSLQEAMSIRACWPAVPARVSHKLADIAGDVRDDVIVRRLGPGVDPPGLTEKDGMALLAANPGVALWSVENRAIDLSVVMRSPLADVYLTAATLDRDARSKNSGINAAMRPYILDAIVWSNGGIEASLAGHPGQIADLRTAYLRMGGEAATVRSKRL